MKPWICSALVLAVVSVCAAGEDVPPLPKYLTPYERTLPLPQPTESRAAPTGMVYCPAEYEANDGLLIRWTSGFQDILADIVVPVTTIDPDAIVYVVVTGASEQSSATSYLSSAGADMGQVEFIRYTCDSVWIRDYGPRFIFEDDDRAMIDHTYNRPRPNDNAFTNYLSSDWGEPQYDIPLTHGGGNFHLFANGDAFMTELILNENSGLTEQQVKDYYLDYQNLNVTITEPFPTSVDSTQHIDMWMLPTGDNEVIIGQYTFDPPQTITNEVAAEITARGYTVRRTPGWTSGGTHYTYTNAVVLNNIALIPWFNHANDATALAVFQAALPGYTIQQVDCRGIIGYAGALHCIVMHVPEYSFPATPRVNVLRPDGGETLTAGEQYEIRWSAIDSGGRDQRRHLPFSRRRRDVPVHRGYRPGEHGQLRLAHIGRQFERVPNQGRGPRCRHEHRRG